MTIEATSTSFEHFRATRRPGTAFADILTPEHFSSAVAEIRKWKGYAPTPLCLLTDLAASLDIAEIFYKDEGPRFGLGSFKALGGSYAASRVLLQEVSRITGQPVTPEDIRTGRFARETASVTLVSATDGNHGRSLAWGARNFGASCRIYIHAEVSKGREKSMRELGAIVTRIDGDYDESVRIARQDAEQNGWHIVSDTTWEGYVEPPRDVMAGYGVLTREIVEAIDQPPTHVFLQGGVGGLAASVAAGLRQHWGDQSPRVIVVEPDLAACLFASAKKGKATTVKIEAETIMAGLSCGEPSPLAWEILEQEASDFITIRDSKIAPTMRLLGNPPGQDQAIVAGESAVAGLAALIEVSGQTDRREKLELSKDSRVLIIGTEGATDKEIYDRIMSGKADA